MRAKAGLCKNKRIELGALLYGFGRQLEIYVEQGSRRSTWDVSGENFKYSVVTC